MAGFLGSILGRAERKSVAFSDRFLEIFGQPTKSGVAVGVDSTLKCMTALAAVRVLSQGIAQPEFALYKRGAKDKRVWDRQYDHPVSRLLDQPNEWQTSFEFRETMMLHACLAGQFIAFKNRGASRTVVRELIPIMPGAYSIEQQPDYSLLYRLTFTDGRQIMLGRDDVLHVRGPSWNSYAGLEAIQLAREAIGLGLATEEAHARLHSNGVRPGGLLTQDPSSTAEIGDEEIKAIKESWNAAYGGTQNAMKTAVLTGGLKWQQLAMTGVDSEHLDTRRFQIEEICRGLGVFPIMVGHSDKSSTFASVDAFLQAHVNVSLLPWATRVEQACSRDLLTTEERAQGYAFDIDLLSMLRGDPEKRRGFYATTVPNGILTRNEARIMEGLNPIDGLDEPLSPANAAGAAENSNMKPSADPTKKAAIIADLEAKLGRVLSASNERRLSEAVAMILEVLQQVQQEQTVE